MDQFSGEEQNQPGGDGIGDTPYALWRGSDDRYPLLNPLNHRPSCAIGAPSPQQIIAGAYTVSGTAFDPELLVEMVEVKIDGGPWAQANGTTTWSYEWVTAIVADGNHTIYARSYDESNYSDEVSVTVVVDNAVPPPDGEESIFEQAWFWALFVLIVVLVVLIAVLFLKKRKGRQGENRLSENEKPDL